MFKNSEIVCLDEGFAEAQAVRLWLWLPTQHHLSSPNLYGGGVATDDSTPRNIRPTFVSRGGQRHRRPTRTWMPTCKCMMSVRRRWQRQRLQGTMVSFVAIIATFVVPTSSWILFVLLKAGLFITCYTLHYFF